MTFSIGLPFFKSSTEVAAIHYSLIDLLKISMFDGITRIVAKYKFEPIRSTTLATFLQYYPTSLHEWDTFEWEVNSHHLRLAIDIDTKFCLPSAFISSVATPSLRQFTDILNMTRTCWCGRFIENHIFKLKCEGRDYNKIAKICGQKIRSTSYATKPDSLSELQDLLVQTEFSLCAKCSAELKCKVDNERRRIWDMLSSLRLAPHGIN
ncbi:hypothetical protein M422DRAFT_45218 [Sphaerobolus stellatus SS14]|nr:hypothetical protein M422DRAFT_45218 [Sphaerobolus stellatus SS14]